MKKNISYRNKLLELAKIYKISDIQNYIKNKKNLTTSQIEHLLKKNNVPIPKDFNVGFFERNISKPFSKATRGVSDMYGDTSKGFSRIVNKTGKGATGLYDDTSSGIQKFFVNLWKNVGLLGLGLLNTLPKIISTVTNAIGNTFVNLLNNIYDSKVHEKKANQIVSVVGYCVAIVAVSMFTFTMIKNFKNEKTIETKNVIEKNIKDKKKSEKNTVKKNKSVEKKKEQVKLKPKVEKKEEPKKKEPSQVTELVLPNLNLKTETVLSLFEDVDYDLKTVRFQKKVKPIYFTQFPKDLDEIKDTQLKKETFIKIVLPLVVAENEKILDDRFKLKQIKSKRMTSDQEKSWLRQKFREYKVRSSSVEELERRMDIIPVSIALAQAAKESGWGTSRFALEGNAIFGQWTWTGQGIEPLSKGKNEGHKVLRFPILRASVKAYKNNLNTHKGYKSFREKRNRLRERNKRIKGLALTDTLDKYAQTGKEYTKVLEEIIEQNNLTDFETVQLTNSVIKKELNL